MSSEIRDRLYRSGVVPVMVIDDAAHAVPLARALLAGGIDVIEITFRTPAAADAIGRIVDQMPQMLVGAGTLLTGDQARQATRAGAVFGVSTGLNPNVVRAAQDAGMLFMPGIATPTDIEAAVELGCTALKFFPAEPIGGLAYLKSVAAPYSHLGLKYCPLGGVSTKNVRDYLSEPIVLCGGGSWIAKRDRIAAEDWTGITATARDARQAAQDARGEAG